RIELYLGRSSVLVLGSSHKLAHWPDASDYPIFACDNVLLMTNCRLGWQIVLPVSTTQSGLLRLEVDLAQFILPELSMQFDPSLTIVAAVSPTEPQPQVGQLMQYLPLQLGPLHVQTTASLEQVLKPVNTLVSWFSLISLVLFSMLVMGALLYWRQLILAHQLSLKGRAQAKNQLQTAFFATPFVGMAIVSRPDLRLIESNSRLQQMLQQTDPLQQRLLEHIVVAQDWPEFQQALTQLPSENAQMSCPLLLARPNLPPLPVQLSIYTLKPDEERASVLLLSIEDVSERQDFKSNLNRRAQLMATMATLSQQLLQDSDWLAVLRNNLHSLAVHLQADNIFLYQCHHHADGTEAWRLANWRAHVLNVQHDFVHLSATLLEEFEIGSRLGRGEIIAGPLSSFSEQTQQKLGVNGVQALAVFPVMVDQFWWGFIGLSSEQVDWCWSQTELDTLKLLADNFGNAIKRQQFETSLQQAAVVFESTREGIMVTDHDNRITQVNQSLLDMLGYEENEVLGQDPHMFSSGQHSAAFYRELWQQLHQQGHWQGEIWNRRKNGEVYPELLSISCIYAADGSIQNYVSVFADITQLKASQQELEFLAHHDVLTGLPNRLMMLSRLDGVIDTASRQNQSFALMMLDLDRFKYVNDSFGHPAGDELLKLVAQSLRLRLRKVDTLARFGGDEFMVLLPILAHEEDAGRLASELIAQLNQSWTLSNNAEVRIGVSIGIALYPQHGNNGAALLQNADAALYRAKEQGRNRFAYYSDDLTQYARTRIDVESRLRHA
ncbi:MAG: diguanylate cyclase domain-containing protein, partial [Rheinheimera sp.]